MNQTLKNLLQYARSDILSDYRFILLYIRSRITHSPPTPILTLSQEEFLDELVRGKSFIRFGDGETVLLTGRDIYFQPGSKQLTKSLRTIIDTYSKASPYIIGVVARYVTIPESQLDERKRGIWRIYRIFLNLYLKRELSYADTLTFYYRNYFKETIAPLFRNRHVICVSNANVLDPLLREYMQNTFAAASFIITPNTDAFASYTLTKEQVLSSVAKLPKIQPLVLCAAGPSSKILAYELSARGIQCLDLGHGLGLIAHDADKTAKL